MNLRSLTLALILAASLPLAATATIRYVDLNNPAPAAPFDSWTTAATNIQHAIDAAQTGDEVLVTNGVYQTGGVPWVSDYTNRIVVYKPIVVRSVNGPAVTVIRGVPGISASGARCAYLVGGATLGGFTLTDGGTRNKAFYLPFTMYTGAGVFCESASALITNCVISGNAADESAGGVYGGTLRDCEISGNYAGYHGGGAFRSSLTRCKVNSNQSWNYGGGAEACALTACMLSSNYAGLFGAGAYQSTLDRCVVANNSGWWGGGIAGCTASNSLLVANGGYEGGGAHGSELFNCALVRNGAGSIGGGVLGGRLINCTVTGNSAVGVGGGAYDAEVNNGIVYFNTAPTGSNYSGGVINWTCTSPLPTGGTNNSTADPLLADGFHLSAYSPCLGAGSVDFVGGLDLDGEAWLNPPAVGCDQFHSGNATGALALVLRANHTNVTTGFVVSLTAEIIGHAAASRWDFGDGTILSNHPWASHAWAAAGDYTVEFTAYNDDHPAGASESLTVHVQPPVHYVALDSANPVPAYSTWATAATNIQDALDAAFVGSKVIVSNGVYVNGARAVGTSATNRVVVPPLVTLQSLNGAAVTVIEGYQSPGTINDSNAVRCVWLSADASLIGFTLTNGATVTQFYGEGPPASRTAGGGVYCDAASAIVSRCVMIGNSASYHGGGAYSGTLNQCLLLTNWAGTGGGGVFSSALNNCTIVGNTAGSYGGGAFYSTLNNCIIHFNTAPDGADQYNSSLAYCSSMAPPDGGGNITNPPVFLNTAGGDFRPQANSPGINAGNNAFVPEATDFAGNPRVVSGTVDLGAYEYQGGGSMIAYGWLQQFGLPTDGSVDFADEDQDGHNTWQEWRADSVPTNAASRLALLAPMTPTNSPDGLVLMWQSSPNRSYFLQRATNTAEPFNFLPLATNLIGQPGTSTYFDMTAGGGPCYYRVGVQP